MEDNAESLQSGHNIDVLLGQCAHFGCLYLHKSFINTADLWCSDWLWGNDTLNSVSNYRKSQKDRCFYLNNQINGVAVSLNWVPLNFAGKQMSPQSDFCWSGPCLQALTCPWPARSFLSTSAPWTDPHQQTADRGKKKSWVYTQLMESAKQLFVQKRYSKFISA